MSADDSFTRRLAATVLAAAFLVASAASAQTSPYSFSIDSFSIPERGVFDDFDDGFVDPAWNGTVIGTQLESGTTMTLSSPGVVGAPDEFLPAPIVAPRRRSSRARVCSSISAGSFTATSVWNQQVPPRPRASISRWAR